MTNPEIKQLLQSLGADLCGIASVDRFDAAPQGFHPLDVFPQCKSVVAFACRFPVAALSSPTPVTYTRVRNSISEKIDAIALDACMKLEELGILAVPIPAVEAVWDGATGRKRSPISLKHAAQAAGLGTIGRNSLLLTPEFGAMVWLGAILTDAELEADPLSEPLCTGCGFCVNVCPVGALNGEQVDQDACYSCAFGEDPNLKRWVISCHRCRDVCPHLYGTKNTF
jgi:epoxyqueuosine reductase QueG